MKRKLILMWSLCGLSCLAYGNSEAYDEFMLHIQNNNPDLQRLRADLESSVLELEESSLPENPEVEFGYLWGTNNPENKWDLSISQTFDFPTLYSARRRAIGARRTSAELEYHANVIEKRLEAMQLLIELAYCDKALRIQKEVVENLGNVTSIVQKAFDNGECTILDVNKSRIEHANSCIAVNELCAKRREIVASLSLLTGSKVEQKEIAELGYPGLLLHDYDYYQKIYADNPLVEAYMAVTREAETNQRIARMGYLPQITLGYQHEREGRESFDGFKVGITLPFFTNRKRSQLAEKQAVAAKFAAEAKRIELESALTSDYEDAVNQQLLIEMLAPVFNQTNHPALLLKSFKGGQMSATEYLSELNYFRVAEQDFLIIERDYYLSLAKLNRFM